MTHDLTILGLALWKMAHLPIISALGVISFQALQATRK
jgi:hypothetical protein